ncbi:MAG: hypothetical protein NVSMB21_13520 [Vulcanimicrobiaceae bacterium]
MKSWTVVPATIVVTAWDRLVASDPGLGRLSLATRVSIAVLLATAVLAPLAASWHAPLTVVLFGAVVAMQASLVVTDSAPRTTTSLVPIPGFAGVTLGAFFASRGPLAEVVFLVVLFGAVAVRAYGPRWTALGTIAMMTYFFSLFIGATVAQIAVLGCAVVVGTACSYVARFVVVPDRAAWIARRTLEAYEARIRRVVVAASDVVRTPAAARPRSTLRTALRRLKETATAIGSRFDGEAAREFRIVYDAELAASDLALAVAREADGDAPLPRAVRLALVALGRGRFARAARIARSAPQRAARSTRDRAVATAIVVLAETIERVKTTADALARSDAPWIGSGAQQPALRQAVQVTVASAVAIALGEALSPQRWYWAVLATYFVFLDTASAGETLARAWSRIAGTGAGALAGVLAGLVAGARPEIAVVALFVSLFFCVYVSRVSHAMMMFFLTASLALLYIVLGRFSDDLLEIRLAETAIGAVCGGFAATFILPTRTRDVAATQARTALEGVRTLVRTCVARLGESSDGADPLATARDLEEHVQTFVARARPLVATPSLFGRRDDLRRWCVLLENADYLGRTLARVVDRATAVAEPEARSLLAALDGRIGATVDAALARIDAGADAEAALERDADTGVRPRETATLGDVLDPLRTADGDTSTFEAALDLLERIDATIARITNVSSPSRGSGIPPRP